MKESTSSAVESTALSTKVKAPEPTGIYKLLHRLKRDQVHEYEVFLLGKNNLLSSFFGSFINHTSSPSSTRSLHRIGHAEQWLDLRSDSRLLDAVFPDRVRGHGVHLSVPVHGGDVVGIAILGRNLRLRASINGSVLRVLGGVHGAAAEHGLRGADGGADREVAVLPGPDGGGEGAGGDLCDLLLPVDDLLFGREAVLDDERLAGDLVAGHPADLPAGHHGGDRVGAGELQQILLQSRAVHGGECSGSAPGGGAPVPGRAVHAAGEQQPEGPEDAAASDDAADHRHSVLFGDLSGIRSMFPGPGHRRAGCSSIPAGHRIRLAAPSQPGGGCLAAPAGDAGLGIRLLLQLRTPAVLDREERAAAEGVGGDGAGAGHSLRGSVLRGGVLLRHQSVDVLPAPDAAGVQEHRHPLPAHGGALRIRGLRAVPHQVLDDAAPLHQPHRECVRGVRCRQLRRGLCVDHFLPRERLHPDHDAVGVLVACRGVLRGLHVKAPDFLGGGEEAPVQGLPDQR